MLIPRTRYPKFAMYIRHPLLGRVDVTSYVDSWEFKRGDVGGIGTGGSGADSVVSILTFTLRNSGQNLYAWDENAEVDETRQIDESKEIPDSMPAKDFFAYLFGVDPELQIESFSPRANAWWNEGEPLLDDSRKVELWESEEGELKLRCIMLINEVKPDKSRVKVTALDPAQILQRAYILDKKTYGTEEGTPAETVIQQIIVENAPNFVSPDEITSTEHYQLTIKHATETFDITTNPQTFTLQHEPISLSSVSVTDWSLTSRELSPAEYTLNGNQITINIPEDPLTMLGATFVYTYRLPLFTGGDSRTFEFSYPIVSAEGMLIGEVNRPLTPSEIVIDHRKITITVDPSDTNGYESLDLTYTYQPDFFYCPVPSQFMITPYEVQYKTVWEAIQDIATQRGWYLGFKMVNGEWKLSFLEPPRSKTTPDWTLTADDDIYTQDLTISAKDVRNLIKITYRDKSTGKRESVVVEDKASQARHGLMAMEIEEADTSNIDTEEEALRMANSALHDLSSQTSNTNINMPLFMDIDLFDIIAVENQFLSSTVDLFAVDSVSHSWSKGKMRTDLICSGKVVGGKKRWLMKETRAGRSEPIRGGEIAPEDIDNDRIKDTTLTSSKYLEVRNVMPWTGEGILDYDHPYEYTFEIPSETTRIVQIKLSARAERFRTYASGAASGGEATHTSSVQETQVSSAAGLHHHALVSVPASTSPVTDNLEHWHRYVTVDFEQVDASTSSSTTGATVGIYDPGHSHSVGAIGGTGPGGEDNHTHTVEVYGSASSSSAGVQGGISDPGHAHVYTKTNISYAPEDTGGALSGERTHSHEYWRAAALSEDGGEHTHTVPAHSHTVVLSPHTHDLVYDIYEDTTPDQVLLYCDNGAGYGEPIALAVAPPDSTVPYVLCSEKDLTSFFTTPGWKRIKLTSNRRGRITFQIIAKLDITA